MISKPLSPVKSSTILLLCALAVLFTVLNAPKPLMIDDAAYHYYADQAAQEPLDPYGFDMFWYQHPDPANHVLAPPVLPYWWSLAIRLFGESPVMWKLWLFPFSLLFVAALYALLRRFAPGVEMPVVWMTVLSPTFLPSFNLMLDIPALALSLGAVALFLRASDQDSFLLAGLAGLTAGVAAQTKYTAFLAPAVMLIHAGLFRKLRLWIIAVAITVLVFAAWEGFLLWCYGESHFLFHYQDNDSTLDSKLVLILPLLTILGGITGPILLLGIAALGCSRRIVWGAIAALALGYLLLALVPEDHATFTIDPDNGQERLTLNNALFGGLGLELLAVTALVIIQLFRVPEPKREVQSLVAAPVEWFLVLWLLLEVAGFFALTPFPAARRVMGIVIVATLLASRLAARTCLTPGRQRLIHTVAAAGIALGVLFYGVNLCDAWADKTGVERAAEWIHEQHPRDGATIWYVGHWGFQYYAERANMEPVIPDYSCLRPNDWLVVPEEHHIQQKIQLPRGAATRAHTVDVTDRVPFRTVMCYFGGRTALEHHERPRLHVSIFRITRDCCPLTPPKR
jgi:hypothetical protein